MKKVRIKFVGFWEGWKSEDNFIINTLKKVCNPILSDEPEILFSSTFSDEYMDYDCVRVFYTGENICPDFNEFDYAIGFDDISFGDRYIRYPLYLVDELYGDDYHRMLNKHIDIDAKIANKSDFCSFVVSNCVEAEDIRTQFFNKLSEYKKVNSGGRYLNNIGKPEGVEDKLEFQMKHKFSITFENSSHPGYITEKLVQGFAACTVPIYFGDKNVVAYFNKDSFININDYNDLDEVVEAVKKVDADDELYRKMLGTPALVNKMHKNQYDEKLTDFLRNIVEQDISDAVRVCRHGFNFNYIKKHKAMIDAYNKSAWRLHKVADKIYKMCEK